MYSVEEVWNADNTSCELVTEDVELLEYDCSISSLCARGMALRDDYQQRYGLVTRNYYVEVVE